MTRIVGTKVLAAALVFVLVVSAVPSTVGAVATTGAPTHATERTDEATATIDTDGDELRLQAGPGQAVSGRTSLPAGTEVSVRLHSTGDTQPAFIRSADAVVAPDGSFRAVFDLSSVEAGASVEASVVHNGTVLARTPGRILQCESACAAVIPETPNATVNSPSPDGTIEAGPGRTVNGTANLPPGTTLTVRMEGTGSTSFLHQGSAVVDDTGAFRAGFDLTRIPAPAAGRITVRHNGTVIASRSVEVTTCEDDCEPPEPPEAGSDSSTMHQRNQTLYDDLATVTVDQGSVARIELTLEPRTSTLTIGGPNLSYALNLSVIDGNDDDRVVVLFETAAIGQGDAAVSVADERDEVSVIDERVDGNRSVLDEGVYPLVQSVGGLSTERDDNATTFLVERGRLAVTDTPIDGDGNGSVVESPGIETENASDRDAEPETIRGTIGEPTRMTVRTDEAKAMIVRIGPYNGAYTLTAVVRDGDGDERVGLAFDTSVAAGVRDGDPLVATSSEDSVVVTYENGTLAADTYRIVLSRTDGLPEDRDWETATDETGRIVESTRFVVAEGVQSPTQRDDRASPRGGIPIVPIGALAVAGLFATVGIGLVTGAIKR
ncbi:BGTF surface domain-containing protein [Halobaculum magnesiiphilum]|uniref:DUF7827 domain-containing protein n=1 Tax=Halobaculum magnesiiphilum TaxID=1017351 RepID=A0A8T8WAP1_9EURY|nr:BGTF surface domain-containing protein [Halobaculum magnesiiphilum]QZP36833.1 hypothetical protein K6T50_11070 [Halobaculum magnesiiphilum]